MKKLRFLSLALALVILVSVTGCSKKEDPTSTTKVQTLADELGYGYVTEYSSFPVELDYINRMLYSNGRIIILGEKNDSVTYETSRILFSMLPDCTDVKMLEMPDIGGGYVNNMTTDSEGNIWMQTYEYIYESGDGDTPVTPVTPVTPEPFDESVPGLARDDNTGDITEDVTTESVDEDATPEDELTTDDTVEEPEPALDPVAQEKLNLAIAAGDYTAASEYYNENYTAHEEYKLLKLDSEGRILNEFNLNDLATGSYFYVNNMQVGTDGYIYMIYYSDDKTQLGVFDGELNKLFSVTNGDYYIESLLSYDGQMYIQYWGDDGIEYKPVDIATKSLSAAIKPSGSSNNYYNVYTGQDGTLYTTDDNVFGVYDLLAGTIDPMFNWIDCDINSNYSNNVIVLSDKEIIVDSYDYTLQTRQLIRMNQVPASEIPESIYLTYACTWINYNIKNAIISFNRTNGKYRITIKDYSQYSTDEDWRAGYTALNNDIIAGNVPDIIALDNLNISTYSSKGLLADLYSLIDNDPEIGRDYFTDGALNAMEQNGKLYQMGLSFDIMTLVGLSSVVGDTPGWTVDQMMAAYNAMPEGAQLMQWMTKESFLTSFVNYCLNDYINYETGKCTFDSEDFIKLLEMANTFPENFDNYYDEDYEYVSDNTRMKRGDLMLTSIYYSGFGDINWQRAQFMNTDITYIGYPRTSGVGHTMYLSSAMALSAKSQNQDGAWQFIKFLIGDDFQSTLSWTFPVSKSRFEQQAKEAMEPSYYTDENGEKVEYEDTYWVDDEEITLPSATQADIDKVIDLIKSIDSIYSYQYDETMTSIITEEAQAFFAGSKTAQEVANLIQNRVSTYIMESM